MKYVHSVLTCFALEHPVDQVEYFNEIYRVVLIGGAWRGRNVSMLLHFFPKVHTDHCILGVKYRRMGRDPGISSIETIFFPLISNKTTRNVHFKLHFIQNIVVHVETAP